MNLMSLIDAFDSIERPSESFFKEKSSKFYGLAFPVSSIEAADNEIENVKLRFPDARHVCFAYRIGPEGDPWRAYDAGEPANSAGAPILNEIRSQGLSNVLVVVVRYFGGTKLGIPGLIDAYRATTRLSLEAAIKTQTVLRDSLEINFPYTLTSEVNRLLHAHDYLQDSAEYTENCRLRLRVRKTQIEELETKLLGAGIQCHRPAC